MSNHPADRWARLEEILTALKPGDRVVLDALAAETGFPHDVVRTLLHELTKSALFTKEDDRTFVRRSLWQQCP
jgi:DNA-binding GntR family transcriptional regulator